MTNSLCKRLHIDFPLFLAPMAGGPTTPELVAAVSNAGGLGSLGGAYSGAREIEKSSIQVRKRTQKPFAVNLFVPANDPTFSADDFARAVSATESFRKEFNLPTPTLKAPYTEDFDSQFEAVLKIKPVAFSFVFGNLDKTYLAACHQREIFCIGTATTLEEAIILEETGVDAVILQGVEAGGHRGIFKASQKDPGIGIFELTQQCVKKIKIPLVAAGGLMNGKDVARILAAGAQGAQMGTAFLLADEAGTSRPYRRALQEAHEGSTCLTRAFSGRIARGLKNNFSQVLDTHPKDILPFPVQNVFTRDIRKASTEQDKNDCLSLWAGTNVGMIKKKTTATELVQEIISDFNAVQS